MPEGEQERSPGGPTLIVIGPPGAGKSTVASLLADRLKSARIETGELLRKATSRDDDLAERLAPALAGGDLAPQEIVDAVVAERLGTVPRDQGVIIDGYPRTVQEATALREMLARAGRASPAPIAIVLRAPGPELRRRLHRRRLQRPRPDDDDRAISRRLAIYRAAEAPLLCALAPWARVMHVDADRPAAALVDEILADASAVPIGGAPRSA
jgi:adenylate kinase